MMTVDVRPVPVPNALGTPEAAEFEACAALGFRLERATWGHDDFAETAAELLGRHHNDTHRGHALFGAWDGDTMIGRSGLGWERDAEAATVELTLGVLPSHRRRGVGSLLLAAAEQAARELGRSTVVAYSDHADTAGADGGVAAGDVPVLHAPDGDAVLPASVPAAGFAAAHGYSLAQLERVSRLTVSGRTDAFRRELESRTARASADGYRLELWTDRTPDDLVDAYAAARERMVLDVPAGGVTIDEERWDAARVRERESESLDGGMRLFVAAAVAPDGAVAGYTELELPLGRELAYQYDTLVVGPHRGHGLGMLVKLANLVRLAEAAPERSVVYTWNADENDHMLAINIELGFRRCGLEAIWQRADDVAQPTAD
jgi:GNAT superfamily N-acetyltransferase